MDILHLSFISAEKRYEEELTIIQTNILLHGTEKKVISLVPLTNEKGAFTLASCLAESFAKGHRNVPLVDISREGEQALGLSDAQCENGLYDILEGDLAAFSYIRETDVNGVYYLFAGSKIENARELLGGVPFEAMISSIKEQYDYVFLLMPPANQSMESIIVSRVVDGNVMIVSSGISYNEIQLPVEMIKKGSPVIGSILIKKKTTLWPPFVIGKKQKKTKITEPLGMDIY